jgi:hypothetical protein
MKCLIPSMFVVLYIATAAGSGTCQIGSATEAAAGELVEVMLRQGGREAATELAEMGGEAAVRELLNRAAREGGEELVERVAQYGAKYGPSALKAVERSPSRMIQALDRVSPDLIEPAIRAAAREPGMTARLVGAYGKDALELAAKHPGVGARLAEKLGANGIRIGKNLTTDQATTLARYADDIAVLPLDKRSQLLDAMMKAPTRVLDFLEQHPKILLTSGGVAAIIATTDNLFGGAGLSPKHETPPPGLVERVVFGMGHRLAGPVGIIAAILVAGILCRVAIGVRSAWQLKALQLQLEEARVAAEIARQSKAMDNADPGRQLPQ